MPGASTMTTPVAVGRPTIGGRYAELDGYTVGFETFSRVADPAPCFADLPGDRCPCPRWGVVRSGPVTFRWADHEETHGAGDANYAAPGHVPRVAARTGVVELSTTDTLGQPMAVIERNLGAAVGGAS